MLLRVENRNGEALPHTQRVYQQPAAVLGVERDGRCMSGRVLEMEPQARKAFNVGNLGEKAPVLAGDVCGPVDRLV